MGGREPPRPVPARRLLRAAAGASDLPGLECSGIVAATGPGVTRWKPGDRVCALLPGGGYAEYATCAADHALPVPYGLDLRAAAALPETAFTVWSNVVMRGGLGAGERFLVHGGSSGIGTMAIQVANALGRGSGPRRARPRNARPAPSLAHSRSTIATRISLPSCARPVART